MVRLSVKNIQICAHETYNIQLCFLKKAQVLLCNILSLVVAHSMCSQRAKTGI